MDKPRIFLGSSGKQEKLLALTTWQEINNGNRFTPRKNGASAVLIGKKRKFIRKPATRTCRADLFSASGPRTANCAGPE